MTVLIFDLDRGFRAWHISEIYLGPAMTGNGRTVPNIDDMVIDWTRGVFKVTYVDNIQSEDNPDPTYIPTLQYVNFSVLAGDSSSPNTDFYLYQPSVLELAFVNSQVTPHEISIDDRYRAYGTEAIYAKLFKGSNVSTDGIVISKTYNQVGEYIGENITLYMIDTNNPAIKRPPVIKTDTALYDGEIVTLVLYSQSGGVTGEHKFLVKNSDAIRGLINDALYITDIKLVTDMLDPIEFDLINVPANIPVTGGDFTAELCYSDGVKTSINIGTNKCKLHGLTSFNTGLVGARSKVVLSYYPDQDEAIINASNPSLRSLSHVYEIQALTNNLHNFFKIYLVPRYNAAGQVFTIDYYLTNLNYQILIKLEPSQISVRLATGGNISLVANGVSQDIVMSVIMSSIFEHGYTGYTFVQSATIQLGSPATTLYLIDYRGIDEVVYGAGAIFRCNNTGTKPLELTSGEATKANWLAKLWNPLHAIFDIMLTDTVLTPSHFKLRYNGILSSVKTVQQKWDQVIASEFNTNWINGSTIEVIWLYPSGEQNVYLTLGVSPVMIQTTLP